MRGFVHAGFAVFVVAVATAFLGADDAGGKKKAAPLPVTAKLIAHKATYTLDLGGKTAEQFRESLKDAEKSGRFPEPPAVDLTLELANTSDKEVTIWGSGDPVRLELELKGKGAIHVKPRRVFTREFRLPRPVTLMPGKSHTLAIKKLQFGFRGVSGQAYWTEPGEYTLTARFSTAISPPPPDSDKVRDGFARVTLIGKPVKIKVEAK